MEEFFPFRCAFRNCAGEDFFESFEFQQSPVRPHDFVSAVAEEEQPRRAGETTLLALVCDDRQETHRTTNGRQRLRFAALFSCTAHQNWWSPRFSVRIRRAGPNSSSVTALACWLHLRMARFRRLPTSRLEQQSGEASHQIASGLQRSRLARPCRPSNSLGESGFRGGRIDD
jgi:hypothetical protein